MYFTPKNLPFLKMSAITSLLHDFDQSGCQISLGKGEISCGLDMGAGAAVAWTPHEGGVCVLWHGLNLKLY